MRSARSAVGLILLAALVATVGTLRLAMRPARS